MFQMYLSFILFLVLNKDTVWNNTIPLEFTKNEWLTVYCADTKSLLKGYDTNTICNKLSERSGCVINIKSTALLKKYIVIRAYCGHKYQSTTGKVESCRQYKLHFYYESFSVSTDTIFVELFEENVAICHKFNKTRELRGSDRTKAQELLQRIRPEILQRKVGLEISQDVVNEHKCLQHYKTTAVYQKASEERRHKDDLDKNMVCTM